MEVGISFIFGFALMVSFAFGVNPGAIMAAILWFTISLAAASSITELHPIITSLMLEESNL